jgi:NAD(P)-dependent dehydrogenase (short-subunit alcohol dehydrogenase family)
MLRLMPILARFSYPGNSVYASVKGAVDVMTRYMAAKLGSRRISVNVIAPGATATDFAGGIIHDNATFNQSVASNTALGRVGEAEDISGVVAALLSEDTRWINEQKIEISGGIHL